MMEAREVWKAYGPIEVLRGASLRLEEGVTALTGPNGSGKTTLTKILALIERPDAGYVMAFGRTGEELQRLRGFVVMAHQEPVVCRGTVAYNLALAAADSVEEIAEVFGLRPLLKEKAHHLSPGYQKLLTIARAFAKRPKVLLLDEPLAYLDEDKRDRILTSLKLLDRSAILWVTHFPPELKALELRAHYELRAGKTVLASSP